MTRPFLGHHPPAAPPGMPGALPPGSPGRRPYAWLGTSGAVVVLVAVGAVAISRGGLQIPGETTVTTTEAVEPTSPATTVEATSTLATTPATTVEATSTLVTTPVTPVTTNHPPATSTGVSSGGPSTHPVSVAKLQPGDCFVGALDDEVVDLIDCAERHEFAVVEVRQLPDAPGAPYPSVAELDAAAARCSAATTAYIAPSPDRWAGGDRRLVCVAPRT